MNKCKQKVRAEFSMLRMRQCINNEWRDGYCRIHHPDSVAKRRNKTNARIEGSYERNRVMFHRAASYERLINLVRDVAKGRARQMAAARLLRDLGEET